MSKPLAEAPSATFTDRMLAGFARELTKYPAERKRSAVIACLAIIQKEKGWISPEYEKALAEYLEIPPIAVHEATTFYNMCNQHPVGRYKISVCTNLPCEAHGGARAMKYLRDTLGIGDGETTADGNFTIEHCECLGACGDAPVMLVNDRTMCSYMKEEKLAQMLAALKSAEEAAS